MHAYKYKTKPLCLSAKLKNTEIRQVVTGLEPAEKVFSEYKHFIELNCPGTLAQQLAKSAVFGLDIMKKCTPLGSHSLKALPQAGLWEIKCLIFQEYPQYWRNPRKFEDIWRKCHTSIEQACGRLRRQNQQ